MVMVMMVVTMMVRERGKRGREWVINLIRKGIKKGRSRRGRGKMVGGRRKGVCLGFWGGRHRKVGGKVCRGVGMVVACMFLFWLWNDMVVDGRVVEKGVCKELAKCV